MSQPIVPTKLVVGGVLTKISVPTKLVVQSYPTTLVVLGVPTRLVGMAYNSESIFISSLLSPLCLVSSIPIKSKPRRP